MSADNMSGYGERRRRDALVIVAKYPSPRRVKTRLGATIGYEQSALLYGAFLRDLAERFSQTALVDGYDLLWACVDEAALMEPILGADARIILQRGDDFAERLYYICCDVAALGYARTAILGSDSPQVPGTVIVEAFASLRGADVVLGPADDGGYYLVGLWNHPAPPDLFTGITMSTPLVFTQTLERAQSLGLAIRLAPTTFDVDSEADLPRLAHALDALPTLAPRTLTLLKGWLTWMTQVGSADGVADGIR
ncbi:MAG TPA: TIGR04282 family arsenosugar biosynthesis glycosyltransferase [Ktedonobacterales bacterium]|nr:TIGR04282 family arsenosugar biosynthesis glycosyltransferase [Ktedonobacterales bacterium]